MATAPSTSSVSEDKPKVHEVDLEMLTWNIAGSKSEKYFAELRGTVVPIVTQQLGDECVLFLQEIPSNKAVEKFPNVAASVTDRKKDAGVSTPKTVSKGQFKIEPSELMSTENLKNKYDVPEEYAERLYGRKVQIGTEQPLSASTITLLSYHASYKTEERRKKTKDFFETMLKLADNLKHTIIIGGDFNLSILDVKAQANKLETEAGGYQGRVLVSLYVATPRRWDNCIDTFAIVHPETPEHRTECQFGTTTPIYPFPLTNYHKQESQLTTYPPRPVYPWFKFVDYNTLQKTSIKDKLKEKEEVTRADISEHKDKIKKHKQKIKSLSEELQGSELETSMNDTTDEDKKKSTHKEISKHEEEVKKHERKIKSWMKDLEDSEEWLSEPYAEEYRGEGPPAPLWPYSPLHKVLDHDPVVTTLRIKLRESSKVQ